MTTQNWPDPKRPGVPMFPERDGWHILHIYFRSLHYWDANNKYWWDSQMRYYITLEEMITSHPTSKYISPVLTPMQINEMLAAERQWCADACRAMSCDAHYTKTQRDALEEAENAIRNLGAAP